MLTAEAATSEALWEMEGQMLARGAENAGGGAVCCHLTFQTLLQPGNAGKQCYIQDASGRGLC